MPLARRVERLSASMTLAISARAAAMRADGIDVVNLSAGEPDFPTPASAIEAARSVLDDGHIGYTAVAGIPELRAAVAEHYQARDGVDVAPSQTIVTTGAKEALYLALQALCDPGDAVLCASPYWVSYPEMAALSDADFVPVPTRAADGFRLQADAVAERLTERARVLLVNSPCNPTGAVLGRSDIEALAALALEHDLWLLFDEIYAQLTYDDAVHHSFMALGPAVRERTITISGVSKSYAMTGWRLGWAVGPEPVIGAMTRVQSHVTANANTVAQAAALGALRGDQTVVATMRDAFAQRRRRVIDGLAEVAALDIVGPEPEGAFYVFPDATALYDRRIGDITIDGSQTLAQALLEQAHVAVVPGAAFGNDDHIRLSYAAAEDVLEEGLRRLAAFSADAAG